MHIRTIKLPMLLTLMALLPLMAPGVAHAGLNDGMAGYWTFDEGLGAIANDVTGHVNNGDLIGGVAYLAPGKVGTSALRFDGASGYVSVPDSTSLDLSGDFTISAWVEPTAASLSGRYGIVSKDGFSNAFELMLNNGHVEAAFSSDGTTMTGQVSGATPLVAGVWTHIAVTRVGDTLKVFVDGAVDGTATVATSAVHASTDPLIIGATSANSGFFAGGIDDVKVYSRGLYDCEIGRLAGGTGQCLVPAMQTPASPSQQFSMIDTEFSQDIVVDNTRVPEKDMVDMAWLADGHMVQRANTVIIEYTKDQSYVVHGTPVYDVVGVHTVKNLTGGGHGITLGLDGYLYANADTGLWKIDPSDWSATKVADRGYYGGIDTLPNGDIVWECEQGNAMGLYDPATGSATYKSMGSFMDGVATTSTGYIAITMRYAQSVRILDSSLKDVNTAMVKGYTGNGMPNGIAVYGNTLYTDNTDGSISRIDFSGPDFTGQGTETIVAAGGAYSDLASVGPDGSFYISQGGLRYNDGIELNMEPGPHAWGVVRISKPGGFSMSPGVPMEKPVADAGTAQTVECTGNASASVTLDGSKSSDVDGDTLSYAWSWAGGSATGVSPTAAFPMGTTAVTLKVTDSHGHSATATTSVTVQDTTPPIVNAGPDATVEATGPDGANYNVLAQASATDNCCDPTINVSPAASTYPLGKTTVTVSATDCSGNSSSATMVVDVVDTTPPSVKAGLVPVRVHGHEGTFRVVFSASDLVDANPTITATLNGVAVTGGQTVRLEGGRHARVDGDDGMLNIKASAFTLEVRATDASGNTGTASAPYAFPRRGDDDDDIHRGNDRANRHVDHDRHRSEGKARIGHRRDR